ncbi:TRAP transporter small permease [Alkaliphilus peptidifermentans]|uniref:TRAP-type C4-dicarboxylate transport system, small permease component n=1 Tax=Alkaliphilus peptidifermentans DSM 18978 TaxID=1120976 RepID=A0A1G5JTA7_9FIRM|nr:TRAP transporter small permease [Alkaliphilus peptidifermentans]SCY90988.1 TRAP-type C4-dicarboxylate transport system, small permease component [Alkaliphilus peptidifermentans DSM 18978]
MLKNIKNGVFSTFKIIGKSVEWFEVIVLSLGVCALASLLITNVIARTFFKSIYFAEEISELLVILITFTGVSYAVRKARHVRMGAIFDAMNPKIQKVLIFLICGISAIVMFLMSRYSYDYMMMSRRMLHRTPALRLPYWFFLIIIPIGFFSAGIQYIRTIVKNIVEKDVWLSPEQQGDYEAEELRSIVEKHEDLAENIFMVEEVVKDKDKV